MREWKLNEPNRLGRNGMFVLWRVWICVGQVWSSLDSRQYYTLLPCASLSTPKATTNWVTDTVGPKLTRGQILIFNSGRFLDMRSQQGQGICWVICDMSKHARGRRREQQPWGAKWRDDGLGVAPAKFRVPLPRGSRCMLLLEFFQLSLPLPLSLN